MELCYSSLTSFMTKPDQERQDARRLIPNILLAGGLVLTALLAFYLVHHERSESEFGFKSVSDKAVVRIENVVHLHTLFLRTISLMATSNSWYNSTRQAKVIADESLAHELNGEGVLALGFVSRSGGDERKRPEMRKGIFSVWPASLPPESMTIVGISYLDPRVRNFQGTDWGTDLSCRMAMQEACDSGDCVVFAKALPCVKGGGNILALVAFQPIYRDCKVPNGLALRRQELRGFAVMACNAQELFAKRLDYQILSLLNIRVYDGLQVEESRLICNLPPNSSKSDIPRFEWVRSLPFGGRAWTIVFRSRPAFEAREGTVFWIPILGTLLSFSLYFTARSMEPLRSRKPVVELFETKIEPPVVSSPSTDDLLAQVFLEISPECIFLLDGEGKILSANTAIQKVFGFTGTELHDTRLEAILPGLWDRSDTKVFLMGQQEKLVVPIFTIAGKHKSGNDLSLEVALGRVGCGEKRKIVVAIRDATTQQKTMLSLASVQKMQLIGSLTSGVAHDFNNVFTAIISHLELAQGCEGEKNMTEYLEFARTSAKNGAELVARLMAFCRNSDRVKQQINPAELVKETMALLRRAITRRIEIKTTLGPETWTIFGEEALLKQVLIIMCLNARDAMPHGGSIIVELANTTLMGGALIPPRRAGSFVCITVDDNGEGMPKDVLDRLYEPFFTTKAEGRGAGLGLWVARNIIHSHGGWIEVESQVGHGSRFHVFLPKSDSTTEAPALFIAPAQRKASYDGNERILVADDDEMVRNLIRAVLGYRGYSVIEASDGSDAVEKFLHEPVDLLFLDLEMPQLDGWEVLEKIRKKQDIKIPIILCTGTCASDALLSQAKTAGAACVLEKPFVNSELLRTVREVLDAGKTASK